ncbi:MAG: hypothetical protein EOO88_59210 [Pedobacter sp.]|nr:MAG: hypothetical protein EOO88_59210 [Pedobacter sp.]
MKFFAFGSAMVVLLLFSTFSVVTGMANNSDLHRAEQSVRLGDTYQQCQKTWKNNRNISIEYDRPKDVEKQKSYVVLLHPVKHPVLDEYSYASLEFRDDKLTAKYYKEFWRPSD